MCPFHLGLSSLQGEHNGLYNIHTSKQQVDMIQGGRHTQITQQSQLGDTVPIITM